MPKFIFNLFMICQFAGIIALLSNLTEYVIVVITKPVYVYHSVTYYIIIAGYIVSYSIIFLANLIQWQLAKWTWDALSIKYPDKMEKIRKPRINAALIFSVVVPLYLYLAESTNLLMIFEIIHAEAVKYIFWGLLAILFYTCMFINTYYFDVKFMFAQIILIPN